MRRRAATDAELGRAAGQEGGDRGEAAACLGFACFALLPGRAASIFRVTEATCRSSVPLRLKIIGCRASASLQSRIQQLIDVCLMQALPPFLRAVVDRLVAAGVYSAAEAPNHCLVNEYRDGAGIPPHDDGPLYLDKVPIDACLWCLCPRSV